MAVAFTPPQGNRGLQSRTSGLAEAWGGPSHGRSTTPQASRSQGQSDGARQSPSSGGAGPSGGRPSPQRERAARGGQRKAAAEGDSRWRREMSRDSEEEKRRFLADLDIKHKEDSLSSEVQHLRKELEKEKADTEQACQQIKDRIEHEKRESTRMQMVMMKAQLGGSAKDEEAERIQRDVTEKTNEILEAMREIREQQQQAFKQVKSLSYAMLKACSQPTPGATGSTAAGHVSSAGSDIGRVFVTSGTRSPGRSPPRSPPSSVTGYAQHLSPGRGPSPPGSRVGGRQRSASMGRLLSSQVGQRSPSPSPPASAINGPGPPGAPSDDGQRQWFKQMRQNLEQFGDVEVFTEVTQQECMCCNQLIASNYRVRPRKCSHIFHIECLLQWWTEGTCPVCHASFAPEGLEEAAPEARLTERSSSTYTSAARREAAWKQAQHSRRRSPASNASAESRRFRATSPPPSQPRNHSSDLGLRPSQSMEAFPMQAASPVRRSTSQQSNPL